MVVRLEGTNVELGQADARRVGSQPDHRRRHEGRRPEDRGAGELKSAAMSILVDPETRLLVQGLGKTGRFHADRIDCLRDRMSSPRFTPAGRVRPKCLRANRRESGCPIGTTSIASRCRSSGPSRRRWPKPERMPRVVFVPPAGAADAIMEAAAAGMPLIVAITEGVPVADMIRAKRYLDGQAGAAGWTQLSGGDHPPSSAGSGSCRATSINPVGSAWSPARAP